jgi:hypothetical protein
VQPPMQIGGGNSPIARQNQLGTRLGNRSTQLRRPLRFAVYQRIGAPSRGLIDRVVGRCPSRLPQPSCGAMPGTLGRRSAGKDGIWARVYLHRVRRLSARVVVSYCPQPSKLDVFQLPPECMRCHLIPRRASSPS